MMALVKRVGISGGTFDPIHYGHLIIGEEARENLKLDEILFIPAGKPPHKEHAHVTDAIHRYNMVCEAIKTNPFFCTSRIEIDRPGYTYTIDTLLELRAVYKDDVELFFITGADVIPELATWKEYKRVFELCEFVAVLRPGYRKKRIVDAIKELKERYNAKIHLVDDVLISISSTLIRQNVAGGKSIKYLVPEGVEKYIYENGLYISKV